MAWAKSGYSLVISEGKGVGGGGRGEHVGERGGVEKKANGRR